MDLSRPIHDLAARILLELIPLAADSLESNYPLLDYLGLAYKELGWSLALYPVHDDGPPRANLVVSKSAAPAVLFVAHTDTVPAGEQSLWGRNRGKPRAPVVENGHIWGLGASDNLGSIALLLAMERQGMFPDDTAIAFTADEETGGLGAKQLVEAGGVPSTVELVVVCEPTNNLVVLGEKGYIPFDLIASDVIETGHVGCFHDDSIHTILVRGQESHSARPREGSNALFDLAWLEEVQEIDGDIVLSVACAGVRNKVPAHVQIRHGREGDLVAGGTHDRIKLDKLLDFLRYLDETSEELRSVVDSRFLPPEVTLNVGALKRFENKLVFACDLRVIPGFDHESFLADLLEQARRILGTAEIRYPYPSLPPVWQELEPEFFDKMGEKLDSYGKSAYTEAAVFAINGFTAVIAGPGNLHVHRHDESISIAAFKDGAELYMDLARYGISLV
ncbi:MAG TPA: M20/M25/M40 family metallo-hydrolase [Myxococcota bacterium]|nr:M20/M25/M40 family metallo-hydrolase [Myxococcota bacterium]